METMQEISGYLSSDTEAPSTQPPLVPSTKHVPIVPLDNFSVSSSGVALGLDQQPSQSNGQEPLTTTTSTKKSAIGIDQYKFIPLRLSETERKYLSVLENALEVCEYTDLVDVTFSYTRKSKLSRIIESLVDVLSIASGLIVAAEPGKGEKQVLDMSLNDNVPLFTTLFEIGRRYKIMNPTKMRNTYGKLMYLLMDTESQAVKQELKLSFIKPIATVYRHCEAHGALALLADEQLALATRLVEKEDLVEAKKRRDAARQALVEKFQSDAFPAVEVQRVIDSVADHHAYLAFNVRPVERMLRFLTDNFDATQSKDGFSLSLTSSAFPTAASCPPSQKKSFSTSFSSSFAFLSSSASSAYGSGAKLSHNHATQYRFVYQSLCLWKEIMRRLPKLWLCADADMIKESYRLCDTGQGYQRVQSCPRVRQEMNHILQTVQSQAGAWVGLSVVHLGDRDVPNALVFIDKYTQVPRILSPIVQCLDALPTLMADDDAFHRYLTTEFHSLSHCQRLLLSDFFKHGFDGSGDDGGSCIDGRLTSAWNWCSKLPKKSYYHVFLLTGFQGFDGEWKSN